MKSPKAKSPKAPIHLQSFGSVTALYFDHGGYARVRMDTVEIGRLMGALMRFAVRKQRIPDPKVIAAIETLHEYFSVSGKGFNVTITADMVIAGHGVSLEPILKDIP